MARPVRLPFPFTHALRIWWSFTWRAVVFAAPLNIAMGFGRGLIDGLLTRVGSDVPSSWWVWWLIGMIVTLPIELWAIWAALRRHGVLGQSER